MERYGFPADLRQCVHEENRPRRLLTASEPGTGRPRALTALLGDPRPFSGVFFSRLSPPAVLPDPRFVQDRPTRPDRPGFHTLKGSSSDSDLTGPRLLTGSTGTTTCSYSYYLLLNICNGLAVWGRRSREKLAVWGDSAREKLAVWGSEIPRIHAQEWKTRGLSVSVWGSTTDGQRGSDLASLPRNGHCQRWSNRSFRCRDGTDGSEGRSSSTPAGVE